MASSEDHDLKRREEAKREACWNAAERWRVLQETLTWGEQQVGRNTPARCVELQRARLEMRTLDNSK